MSGNQYFKRIAIWATFLLIPLMLKGNYTPFVKICNTKNSTFILSGYAINISDDSLQNERRLLKKYLHNIGISEDRNKTLINLCISDIDLPIEQTRYRKQIYNQAYSLKISSDTITLKSPDPAGIFYGLQTLFQILKSDSMVTEMEIKDWPDFPIRMIMLDPARQHENIDYYKRLIEFCGQYKINNIQIHLTDHESSVLYHQDFPELMHSGAWKEDEIKELCQLASENHINLIPEIESFGHSRMFIQKEDARDYLHQTKQMESDWDNWIFIDIPGYTNMLCPSSEKAITYIEKMYKKATLFNSDIIHIGFDEVDLSDCERCKEKFGNISGPQLFRKHLNQCVNIAESNYEKIGIWGDMILKHPKIIDNLSRDKLIIYDWFYYPNLTSTSIEFFNSKGFEVIACPALMCSPYIIMPSKNNYENVEEFTSIAREFEIQGVNTTVWVPTRYLTDALWIGIAFSAEQSWGGSHWDYDLFLENFLWDFYGSTENEKFKEGWDLLMNSIRFQDIYKTGFWHDLEGIEQARNISSEKLEDIILCKEKITKAINILEMLEPSVVENITSWNTLLTSAKIQLFIFDHIISSSNIKNGKNWNIQLLQELDNQCVLLIAEIEKDWDRNRFTDDPNKDGAYIYQAEQNLLFNFRQMHSFHQKILLENKN